MGAPRIIAGTSKGRTLTVPQGLETRPTNARARQAAFDILLHAPWAGAEFMRAAKVLDVFSGSGAYGLEALSRGAAHASFIEQSPPALAALRANIAACKATGLASVFAADATNPPPGRTHDLVFLDPPYGQGMVPKALAALAARGWLEPGAIILAELGPADGFAPAQPLAERQHGRARLVFWRE